ncbi:MAG: hypothetical protein HN416_11750 [Nitrospina sp.]|nr:hypothetical protein [Nitrospina sp.]
MKKARTISTLVICVLAVFLFSQALAESAPSKVSTKYELKLVKVCIEGKTVTINGVHNFGNTAVPEWNWGDGVTDQGFFPGEHLYEKPGVYKITLRMSEMTQYGTVVKIAETKVLVQ